MSEAHDFTIEFNPVLKLSSDLTHEMTVNSKKKKLLITIENIFILANNSFWG